MAMCKDTPADDASHQHVRHQGKQQNSDDPTWCITKASTLVMAPIARNATARTFPIARH